MNTNMENEPVQIIPSWGNDKWFDPDAGETERQRDRVTVESPGTSKSHSHGWNGSPSLECPGPTHYAGCVCHEKGWQNKWECAVEMAARATVERDEARRMWSIYQDKCAELNELIDRIKDQDLEVYSAARAVVERWETPLWKNAPATAKFINRLRTALSSENSSLLGMEACQQGLLLHRPAEGLVTRHKRGTVPNDEKAARSRSAS